MQRTKPGGVITSRHTPPGEVKAVPDFHDGGKEPESPSNHRGPQKKSGNSERPLQTYEVFVGR